MNTTLKALLLAVMIVVGVVLCALISLVVVGMLVAATNGGAV